MGAGTLRENQSTRLALASPVAVGAGATVGLYVHTADGEDGVYFTKASHGSGAVDASDGAVAG